MRWDCLGASAPSGGLPRSLDLNLTASQLNAEARDKSMLKTAMQLYIDGSSDPLLQRTCLPPTL
jgi:hypothetical protein